jgi:uncharacterized membrane protein (UPF0136 family)
MKTKSYLIWTYALFILIGGLIGFIKAGSVTSIAISGVLAALLLWCGYLVWKETLLGYDTTLGILMCILAFFGYRFLMHYQIFPAIVVVATAAVLIILITKRPASDP